MEDPMNDVFLREKLNDLERALDLEDLPAIRQILADMRTAVRRPQDETPELVRHSARQGESAHLTTYTISIDYRYL
jgi:hypothetical protein